MTLPSPSKPSRTPASPNLLATALSQTFANIRQQTLPHIRLSGLNLSTSVPPASTCRFILILLALIFLLPLLFSTPPTPQTPLETLRHAASLASQPGNTRAQALAAALRAWKSGYPTPAVLATAAACTPRDAADATFRAAAPFAGALRRFAVIDAGAGDGFPISKLALGKGPRWLLAIEPDKSQYALLHSLRRNGVKFLPVNGAVSDESGERSMLFPTTPSSTQKGGCFHCLNPNSTNVRAETVHTHTIDELVLEGKLGQLDDARIALLSVSVGSHEARVLHGAQKLLSSGRIVYARVRFEVSVGRDEALTTVRELLGAGLHCLPLVFDDLTEEEKNGDKFPMFGEAVTWRSADVFYRFVNATGRSTDLLCAKRAG